MEKYIIKLSEIQHRVLVSYIFKSNELVNLKWFFWINLLKNDGWFSPDFNKNKIIEFTISKECLLFLITEWNKSQNNAVFPKYLEINKDNILNPIQLSQIIISLDENIKNAKLLRNDNNINGAVNNSIQILDEEKTK